MSNRSCERHNVWSIDAETWPLQEGWILNIGTLPKNSMDFLKKRLGMSWSWMGFFRSIKPSTLRFPWQQYDETWKIANKCSIYLHASSISGHNKMQLITKFSIEGTSTFFYFSIDSNRTHQDRHGPHAMHHGAPSTAQGCSATSCGCRQALASFGPNSWTRPSQQQINKSTNPLGQL